jgi:hypothetical protein
MSIYDDRNNEIVCKFATLPHQDKSGERPTLLLVDLRPVAQVESDKTVSLILFSVPPQPGRHIAELRGVGNITVSYTSHSASTEEFAGCRGTKYRLAVDCSLTGSRMRFSFDNIKLSNEYFLKLAAECQNTFADPAYGWVNAYLKGKDVVVPLEIQGIKVPEETV